MGGVQHWCRWPPNPTKKKKKNRIEIAKDVSLWRKWDGLRFRAGWLEDSQLPVVLHVRVGLSGLFTLITKIWQMFARLMSHCVCVCVCVFVGALTCACVWRKKHALVGSGGGGSERENERSWLYRILDWFHKISMCPILSIIFHAFFLSLTFFKNVLF